MLINARAVESIGAEAERASIWPYRLVSVRPARTSSVLTTVSKREVRDLLLRSDDTHFSKAVVAPLASPSMPS
jgi:hypothetical protein